MRPLSFGNIRAVPNLNSPYHTTGSKIYDLHWENLQLIEHWDWDRFARFAAFLRHTPYELASLVMMTHSACDSFQRHNRLTGQTAKHCALLLTLIEAHLLSEWKKDIIQNPFPNIFSREPSPKSADSQSSEQVRS